MSNDDAKRRQIGPVDRFELRTPRAQARSREDKLLRIHELAPGLFAFYAGRDIADGHAALTWVEDGALLLGIASYALVHGDEAIVYDTHVSVPHAQAIRNFLAERGVRGMQVVLSHWHLDHVAGTEAFADCPVIAHELTAAHLAENRAAIEDGSFHGPPAIKPLILPTETFAKTKVLDWQGPRAELHHFDIHSDDGVVLWLPHSDILLAGDTLEDTVTYVAEPEKLDVHLAELARLGGFKVRRILPNHGEEAMIASGGYDAGLIEATREYVGYLQSCRAGRGGQEPSLRDLLPRFAHAGGLRYFEPYERVHRQNLDRVEAR